MLACSEEPELAWLRSVPGREETPGCSNGGGARACQVRRRQSSPRQPAGKPGQDHATSADQQAGPACCSPPRLAALEGAASTSAGPCPAAPNLRRAPRRTRPCPRQRRRPARPAAGAGGRTGGTRCTTAGRRPRWSPPCVGKGAAGGSQGSGGARGGALLHVTGPSRPHQATPGTRNAACRIVEACVGCRGAVAHPPGVWMAASGRADRCQARPCLCGARARQERVEQAGAVRPARLAGGARARPRVRLPSSSRGDGRAAAKQE